MERRSYRLTGDVPSDYRWIKERRQELNLSQEDLARWLKDHGFLITRPTISHWETSRYLPPVNDARFTKLIAQALQMSVFEFLRRSGFYLPTDHTLEGERAARIIDALAPEKRESVLRIVETFMPPPRIPKSKRGDEA